MTGSSTLTRQHVSFAIAGVIFGFLMGFVAAHQMHGGRFGGVLTAAAPETMGGARPAMPSGGGAPGAPGEAESGAPSMEMMNQVTQEISALKQHIKEKPDDMAALGRLADLYMQAGMYDRAVEYLDAALKVEPGNVHMRTDRGTCLLMQGKAREALAEFEKCVAQDPSHAKTWYTMGFAHVELGDYDKAEQAFARALELSPGSFDMDALRAEIERIKSGRAAPSAGSAPS